MPCSSSLFGLRGLSIINRELIAFVVLFSYSVELRFVSHDVTTYNLHTF